MDAVFVAADITSRPIYICEHPALGLAWVRKHMFFPLMQQASHKLIHSQFDQCSSQNLKILCEIMQITFSNFFGLDDCSTCFLGDVIELWANRIVGGQL